ncbi:hypothetical protein ACFSX9_00325 [Flavobacterium ardleyense]|uniref:Uncharacterized protein n=1 Tax=Flavobacterium ardleyense TaxID=2038737 RepID=A0ABW5Z376_9FLAO
MKKVILGLFVLGTVGLYAQVGIDTTSPEASLDIVAKNPTGSNTSVEGLLIPRVDRLRAQSMVDVPNSTLIYVNNSATGTLTGQTSNMDAVGFYYYDAPSLKWVKLIAGDLSNDAFIDNPVNTRVELGSKSTGTPRDPNTEFVIKDDGNVGIKTATPSQALHVAGNAKLDGNIFDGTNTIGATGEVLSIDGTKLKWIKTTAATPAVFAIFGDGYKVAWNDNNRNPTGTVIVLPPGKWIVLTNLLLTTPTNAPGTDQSIWVSMTWSNTSGGAKSSDIVGQYLVSGALTGPSRFGMLTGSIVINNDTGANKTYYLTKDKHVVYGSGYKPNIDRLGGRNFSENNIVAIPAN